MGIFRGSLWSDPVTLDIRLLAPPIHRSGAFRHDTRMAGRPTPQSVRASKPLWAICHPTSIMTHVRHIAAGNSCRLCVDPMWREPNLNLVSGPDGGFYFSGPTGPRYL
jgi:hypothetical protein